MKPSKCRVMCPDCHTPKMQFQTEKEAERFIEYNGADIHEHPEELRVYYCPSCCCYHISSKPQKKYSTSTQRLLDAYYQDNGKKDKVIKEIRTILNDSPELEIFETGWRKVFKFEVDKEDVYGIDKIDQRWPLHRMLYCDLESILKKLNSVHNSKIRREEQKRIGREKSAVIEQITKVVALEPNIKIPPTGTFEIVSFYTKTNGKISGVTARGHNKALANIEVDELRELLERVCRTHYKLDENNETTD